MHFNTKFTRYIAIILLLFGCSDDDQPAEEKRTFGMGFTSWSYGPNLEDVNNTYAFIDSNSDIYAEHIDTNIPWDAWMNDLTLPTKFTNEIAFKVSNKITGKKFLLSVSILNTLRDDLASDMDGSTPSYTSLDDQDLKDAYFKHISYLVNQFQPDYLVIAIEVNELRLKSPNKWSGYKNLIADVTSRVKQAFPGLKISESISLHNWYNAHTSDPEQYSKDIIDHINQLDYVAISFYPFLANLHSKSEIQGALDFLHSNATPPIAFVESAQIAENLVIPNLSVSIDGDESGQKIYLETLFENATNQKYEFIIWWAYRDFDALWEVFPPELKDLGQIWRDTGLLDENGKERSAYSVWVDYLGR